MNDYNTLEGEKKRAFLAVIISGLIMGSIYYIISITYETSEDSSHINKILNKSM